MGTTSKMSIPYPENNDFVADGATNMKDIADQVDLKSGLIFINSTSFSTTSTPFINECFNNIFRNYRIMIEVRGSAATNVNLRVRSGTSTTESGSVYDRWGFNYVSAATGNLESGNQTTYQITNVTNAANAVTSIIIDAFNPNQALHTNLITHAYGANNGAVSFTNCRIETTTAYTGLEIYADTGTLTGSMSIYGYNQ